MDESSKYPNERVHTLNDDESEAQLREILSTATHPSIPNDPKKRKMANGFHAMIIMFCIFFLLVNQ